MWYNRYHYELALREVPLLVSVRTNRTFSGIPPSKNIYYQT